MLEDLLDKTLDVESQNATVDAGGGQVQNWTAREVNIPCSLWPVSNRYHNIVTDFLRRDIKVLFECCTAYNIKATDKDRILVEGEYYTVCGSMPYVNTVFDADEKCYITLLGLRNEGGL